MKLLVKTSLLILTVSIVIFMVGNLVFFNVTKQMISTHINNELVNQMHTVMQEIKSQPKAALLFHNNEISIRQVGPSIFIRPHFSDTVLFSEIQKKFMLYRTLNFSYNTSRQNYSVSIYKSLFESDKLLQSIFISSIVMVIIFTLMILLLNRFVFENVWSDFFINLRKVEKYDVKSNEKLVLLKSEIDEFNALNQVHQRMAERIQEDFRNLKDLTANTSHEIQTPLAIIKSKAEILLQSPTLSEKELNAVSSILKTTDRLSKLNQSLLLITRIENNQFAESVVLNAREVLEKHVNNFQMLFEAGKFKLKQDVMDMQIRINPVLLDILISNLLKNALSHSTHPNEIRLELKESRLSVMNTGDPLKFDEQDLFKRFVKGSGDKNSIGLGLEIVNKICLFYSITIQYYYIQDFHHFEIDFSKIIA